MEVAIFNAMSGGTICSFQAGWSWSVLDVKQEISKVIGDATSLLPSGRQLLFDAQILRDNDILKNVSHADAAGADSLHTLELSMLEVSDDFYVRYLAKRTIFGRMEMDHEFHEFEFCSSGRFRFARNFLQQGFFQGKRLRKECYLSAASLNVLKSIVLKSGIMQADDADLPLPTQQSRQELEIKCEGTHVVLATSLHPSLSHIDGGRRLDHDRNMSDFDTCAEDIKSFGKSILEIFGVQLDGAAVVRPLRR